MMTGYGDREDDDDDDGRSMEGYGYGNNNNHNHSHQASSRHAPYGPYNGPSSSSSSSYKEDDANSALSLKRSNSGISKPGSSSGSAKSLSASLRSGNSPSADEERENCPPNDSTGVGPNNSTGVIREHKRGLSAQSAALPKINKNSGTAAASTPTAINAFGGNNSGRR